jgi:hypothetical protein
MSANLIQLGEDLNRTKMLTFSQIRGNSFSLTVLTWEIGFITDLIPEVHNIGLPTFWLQILGFVSLHNHMNQFLAINLSFCPQIYNTYIHTYIHMNLHISLKREKLVFKHKTDNRQKEMKQVHTRS